MRRRCLVAGVLLALVAACGAADDDADPPSASADGGGDLARVDPCSLLEPEAFRPVAGPVAPDAPAYKKGSPLFLSSTVDFVSCTLEITLPGGGFVDVEVAIRSVRSGETDVEAAPGVEVGQHGNLTMVSPPPAAERCDSVVETGGAQAVAVSATRRATAATVDLCGLRDLAVREVATTLSAGTVGWYRPPPDSLLSGRTECALLTEEVRGIVGISEPPVPRGYAQGCTAGEPAGPTVSIDFRLGVDPATAVPPGGRRIDIGGRTSTIAGTDAPAGCRLAVPHVAFPVHRPDFLELLQITVIGYPAEQSCLMAEAIGRLVIGSVALR